MEFTNNGMENNGMVGIAAQTVQAFPTVAPKVSEPIDEVTPAVEQTPIDEEKPYTLRSLSAKDILPMSKIIRKIGLSDIAACFDPEEIKAIMGSVSGEDKTIDDVAETVGIGVVMKIIDVILENLSAVEPELFGFLGGLSGMTADDVGNLPMDVFFEMLVDVFKKKEFVGFMKAVSKLVK